MSTQEGGRKPRGKGKKGKKVNKKAAAKAAKAQKAANAVAKKAAKVEERKEAANEFLLSLGPDGYMKTSDAVNKDVSLDRYDMNSPDGVTHLLERAQIKLSFGRRYGLVGKNGSGKTTLLKNMANYTIEDFPTHLRIFHVEQEHTTHDYEETVLECVLKSDIVRTQLLDKQKELEELQYTLEDEDELDDVDRQLDQIREYMEKVDIDGSIQRASRILVGLGFTVAMQKLKKKDLSGGWRMRTELAKALFINPDLLLLDEPTNHLDFPAVLWLQHYLVEEFQNTLVVVSHDRTFINQVITNVIELDTKVKNLMYYKGNYDQFVNQKEENFRALMNEYRSQQDKLRKLKEFIEQNKDRGEKRAGQVQDRQKMLEKLEAELIEEPREERHFRFKFPEPDEIEQHVVECEDVTFGYKKDKIILRDINLTVGMDTRVGVIGANGVGKSTLIKLMLGMLEATEGHVDRNRQARIAYFTQHHYDQLDLSKNAVSYFLEKFSEELADTPDRTQYVRRHLGRFGISGDRQNQLMKYLSGGQKSRVAFAVLTFKTPHFIVMDEPTNHLDLDTVEALIDALKQENYPGGVLAISHDQHFLQTIAEEFWSVTPEGIKRFRDFDTAKEDALEKRIDEVHYH